MISKKIDNVGHFTLILTVGLIISEAWGYLFRIIALLSLRNNDYGLLIITTRTFAIILPFSSFILHIPLTREIKDIKDDYILNKIIKNFAFSYCLTSSFSFILFIFIGFYFLNFVNILLIIFLALNLIFYSFSEFFIGLSNGFNMPIRTSLIQIMRNLIPGLLALMSLFVSFIQNLNSFILFFGIGYLGSFLVGLYLYKAEIKKYISGKNLIEKHKIKENFKNSSFMLSTNFIKNFSLWIISIFAFSILSELSFKIFDLSLMIISAILLLVNSLSNALIAKQNLKKLNSVKLFKKIIIPIIFFSILIVIFLFFTNLDIIFIAKLLGDVPDESKLFVRISLLIIIPMIISAYFGGRIIDVGKYSKYMISSLFGLIGSLFLLTLAFIFNLSYLLLIALFLEKIIYLIFLIVFYYL